MNLTSTYTWVPFNKYWVIHSVSAVTRPYIYKDSKVQRIYFRESYIVFFVRKITRLCNTEMNDVNKNHLKFNHGLNHGIIYYNYFHDPK